MRSRAILVIGGAAYIGLAVALAPVEAWVRAIHAAHGLNDTLDRLADETNDLIEEMKDAYPADRP